MPDTISPPSATDPPTHGAMPRVSIGNIGQKLMLISAGSYPNAAIFEYQHASQRCQTPTSGNALPSSASGGIVSQPLRATSKWHGPGSPPRHHR